MREVVRGLPTGFQDHLVAAIKAGERPLCLLRQVCCNGLAGEFSFGAEHSDADAILSRKK